MAAPFNQFNGHAADSPQAYQAILKFGFVFKGKIAFHCILSQIKLILDLRSLILHIFDAVLFDQIHGCAMCVLVAVFNLRILNNMIGVSDVII